jgi:hypothetical protein
MGNQKQSIEEGQAMQCPSEIGQRDTQWSTKHYTETPRLSNRKLHKLTVYLFSK